MIITISKVEVVDTNGEVFIKPDTKEFNWRVIEERENEFVIEILE
ncbi:hypothetical protein ACTQ5K_02700 [Niallia sp. Sow4_A1]